MAKHTIYYALLDVDRDNLLKRANTLLRFVETRQMSHVVEEFNGCITVHIETDDDVAAFALKFCQEIPVYESH